MLSEEICLISDLNLRAISGGVRGPGRAMDLSVVGETSLWLGLSSLSDTEKRDLLDTKVDPKGLFGSSVASMQQTCGTRKKEGEALQACLPRKPAPTPLPLPTQRHGVISYVITTPTTGLRSLQLRPKQVATRRGHQTRDHGAAVVRRVVPPPLTASGEGRGGQNSTGSSAKSHPQHPVRVCLREAK